MKHCLRRNSFFRTRIFGVTQHHLLHLFISFQPFSLLLEARLSLFFVWWDYHQGTETQNYHQTQIYSKNIREGRQQQQKPSQSLSELMCGISGSEVWTCFGVERNHVSSSVSVSYQLLFRAPETVKHQIIQRKCSWTLARHIKRDFILI